MDTSPPPYKDELTSAFDWWRDAGVDCAFTDDAAAWLSDAAPEPAKKSLASPAENASSSSKKTGETNAPPAQSTPDRVDLFAGSPPETLEAFTAFWMEAPGLDAIGPRGRIPPRGTHGARLMIVTADPEQGDRDRLLSGPQGQLLNAMLRAMNISDEDAYFASALTRHTPVADTAAIAAGGMDAVVLHHIALAEPKAVLALGQNILPLLGLASTKAPASLREINLGHLSKPFMLTDGLDSLLAMPRLKERFWRRWIEWSAEVF